MERERPGSKPKSPMKAGLLYRDEATLYYRAKYVVAVAREAGSDKLEPRVREKYEAAMNTLLRFDSPWQGDEAKRLYETWIRLLKLPDDDLSWQLATHVSGYTSSLAAKSPHIEKMGDSQTWEEVAIWGLHELMILREPKPDHEVTSQINGQEWKLILERIPGTLPSGSWEILFGFFRAVNVHDTGESRHLGESLKGSIGEQTETPMHRSQNLENSFTHRETIYVHQPTSYQVGMSRSAYRGAIDGYVDAIDLVEIEGGTAAMFQDHRLLNRDMKWLVWYGFEGLSPEKIALREVEHGSPDCNTSTVELALFDGKKKNGIAGLVGVPRRPK